MPPGERLIVAVVPVGELGSAKSRLVPVLGRESASRLALAMLGDVLEALLAVEALGRVAVVTPDADVAATARTMGAEALERDDPGLNPAIEGACAELVDAADDGALVVLGDVAGARPEDLARLVAAGDTPGVALAPADDGGTAALLRRPFDVIPAAFGRQSARAHRLGAEREGVPFAALRLPSLAIDLDSADDLDAFLASDAGGSRTRALLAAIDWRDWSDRK
jgi:2-phospho-L-lactate guanylyltransferase